MNTSYVTSNAYNTAMRNKPTTSNSVSASDFQNPSTPTTSSQEYAANKKKSSVGGDWWACQAIYEHDNQHVEQKFQVQQPAYYQESEQVKVEDLGFKRRKQQADGVVYDILNGSVVGQRVKPVQSQQEYTGVPWATY